MAADTDTVTGEVDAVVIGAGFAGMYMNYRLRDQMGLNVQVFEAGDAFYTPPGHIPVQHEPGTEFVSFSPSEELRRAEAVMIKNMQAMQDGSTP